MRVRVQLLHLAIGREAEEESFESLSVLNPTFMKEDVMEHTQV